MMSQASSQSNAKEQQFKAHPFSEKQFKAHPILAQCPFRKKTSKTLEQHILLSTTIFYNILF